MEMNTRLQVEHPVTEMTTGLDLVEWQLRVAAGEPLPLSQTRISRSGHAIEARIYAEDPRHNFLPSTGTVQYFARPTRSASLRLDSAVSTGDAVSIHYDPMIAKLIVHAADRTRAIAELRAALARTEVFGVRNNLDLLLRICADEVFRAGDADTGYIDRQLSELLQARQQVSEIALLGAACACLERRSTVGARAPGDRIHQSPWSLSDAWQANGNTRYRLAFTDASSERHIVSVCGALPEFSARLNEREIEVRASMRGHRLVMECDGQTHVLRVLQRDNELLVAFPGADGPLRERFVRTPLYPVDEGDLADDAHPGSPMPGRIVALHVAVGDAVQQGQALLVLEGMKMEYTLQARATGTVAALRCKVGDMVDAEVPLVDIDTTQPA